MVTPNTGSPTDINSENFV